MNRINKGIIGEKIVKDFFDKNFSSIFSFPNPKTSTNAEIADVLIWMNKIALLIEVKTRDYRTSSIEKWAYSKIGEGTQQIIKNYNKIINNERIILNNSYYNTDLDPDDLTIYGLIILVHDEECHIYPSKFETSLYKNDIPIHVFSWNDLEKMTDEIDTVPDFAYYLGDRYKYLKQNDIPIGTELNVLGYYKSNNLKFPSERLDFKKIDFWTKYKSEFCDKIDRRDELNKSSVWIDKIENVFKDQRKLFHGIPVGLYFAWELGALMRRIRAIIGDTFNSVEKHFQEDNRSQKSAFYNPSTSNWIVFYFSKSNQEQIYNELNRLVELKLIQSIDDDNFQQEVYGLGFGVSKTHPIRLLGLNSAIVIGADEFEGKYSANDLKEAKSIWGHGKPQKIEEFPST